MITSTSPEESRFSRAGVLFSSPEIPVQGEFKKQGERAPLRRSSSCPNIPKTQRVASQIVEKQSVSADSAKPLAKKEIQLIPSDKNEENVDPPVGSEQISTNDKVRVLTARLYPASMKQATSLESCPQTAPEHRRNHSSQPTQKSNTAPPPPVRKTIWAKHRVQLISSSRTPASSRESTPNLRTDPSRSMSALPSSAEEGSTPRSATIAASPNVLSQTLNALSENKREAAAVISLGSAVATSAAVVLGGAAVISVAPPLVVGALITGVGYVAGKGSDRLQRKQENLKQKQMNTRNEAKFLHEQPILTGRPLSPSSETKLQKLIARDRELEQKQKKNKKFVKGLNVAGIGATVASLFTGGQGVADVIGNSATLVEVGVAGVNAVSSVVAAGVDQIDDKNSPAQPQT